MSVDDFKFTGTLYLVSPEYKTFMTKPSELIDEARGLDKSDNLRGLVKNLLMYDDSFLTGLMMGTNDVLFEISEKVKDDWSGKKAESNKVNLYRRIFKLKHSPINSSFGGNILPEELILLFEENKYKEQEESYEVYGITLKDLMKPL